MAATPDPNGGNSKLWLAIDQGTSSTKAQLFDESGCGVAEHRQPVRLQRLSSSHVEQDPQELLTSVQQCIDQVVTAAGGKSRIQSAGMATQRSSVVAWRRSSGQPISRMLSWQDTRGQAAVQRLRDREEKIQQISGLPLTAHYGATKIAWLLEHAVTLPDQHDICIGPLAAFLVQNLVEPAAPPRVDHTLAGRTQLMDLAQGTWSRWLLEQFQVPAPVLPDIVPTLSSFGRLRHYDIPFELLGGDQTAALDGPGGFPDDIAHLNLGSGAFVLSKGRIDGATRLLRGVAYSSATEMPHVVEGTINGAGAALDWAAQQLSITNYVERLNGWLDVVDRPLLFLNTVGGIGSPFWIAGLSPQWFDESGKQVEVDNDAEAMVGVVESILFLVMANIAAMRKAGITIESLRVSGGLAKSDQVCQRLADLSALPVTRPMIRESTSRGVAWHLAGEPPDWSRRTTATRFRPNGHAALTERYKAFLDLLSGI